MPTQCARRVWPRGGRGLQGPFLSPGVPSTAAAPSFSELLLLGWRLPLPAAGTQASPAPIPEPAELETRHSPGERRRGPAGRLRPSFRGAPRKAAAPPRRSGPSSLPAPAPPSLGAALRSCWGRWAGTRAGAQPRPPCWRCHLLSIVLQERAEEGVARLRTLTYPIGWGVNVCECVRVRVCVCPSSCQESPSLISHRPITLSTLPALLNRLTFPRRHLTQSERKNYGQRRWRPMAVTPPVPPGPRAPRIQYWEAVPSLGVGPRSLLGGMVARKTCL
ncbi:unnamed protein product [Rangifer tarandus platyrhynchus]|uniref:Uncharacterized protein n=1 Tax=Rangifer tarandus platyrhynchus TaxID=3082113 RepID=A0ABN8Y3P5_RANTA|nr:unnamed protein product [Rangifer tarandus platyrhynchus]